VIRLSGLPDEHSGYGSACTCFWVVSEGGGRCDLDSVSHHAIRYATMPTSAGNKTGNQPTITSSSMRTPVLLRR